MVDRLRRSATIVIAAFIAVGLVAPAAAVHEDPDGRHVFANDQFRERWERTDLPVSRNEVDRTYIWGPEPYTEGMTEAYAEAPGGEREVQYWDKSRMELTDPASEGVWAVTNGLLVVEMIEGQMQVGDDTFEDREPAEVNIAGDAGAETGPTYADINEFGLREAPATFEGAELILSLTPDGQIAENEAFSQYGVTAAHRVQVPGIDHTVASVFWDFMNSSGPIAVDGAPASGDLFQDPFYATGYPITEAFWTRVPVGGEEQDVMWQCFERRCLTYTPDNPEGFQVEAGNVGQHYYQWRYGQQTPPEDPPADETQTVNNYFVLLEDDGENGIPIGCGDSLVPQEVEIEASDDINVTVSRTLEALFATDEATVGELDNALDESDLTVDNVQVENGVATVDISGEPMTAGACDDPRFIEQIRHTVLQFDEVVAANIWVNGEYLNGMFDLRGDQPTMDGGVLATFDVSGEVFQVWVTNPETIEDLYAVEAGDSDATIPNGPLGENAGVENHNSPWTWHLDPEETEMAEATIEVCDGAPSYVEENRDEFIEDVGQYCPWNAELLHLTDLR
ncbi:MAG: GerMN domain-containing protein [Chloroflexota bacterium]